MDAFPVGTNVSYIAELAASEATRKLEPRIRGELGDRRFIISIGRTDYTKGTRDMLLAFERLLERRPELATKVQLLVTSVSANQGMHIYRNVQRDIEHLAGRINGRYGTLASQPLLLMTSAIPFQELIAYYRCADVCWVTPLRDGLNLVAKEFVAARKGLGGALVLSEFTGAAVELAGAVMTNPYSTHQMDEAIDECARHAREGTTRTHGEDVGQRRDATTPTTGRRTRSRVSRALACRHSPRSAGSASETEKTALR